MIILKKDNLPINKQREIFNKLAKKRSEKMHKLHNSVDFDSLFYYYKRPAKDKDFNMYNDAKSLYNIIKNKDITLSQAKENQAYLKLNLGDVKTGGKKSGAQKEVIKNVEKFCDSRQAVTKFLKIILQ